jgi:DNA-binding SARP family transcriptional activator
MLSIRLFGELDLRLDGARLPALESSRARSLLAYLLLHRDAAQPRQRLAFMLWPDSTEPQARTNLRHLLHTLRRAVPQLIPYLEVGTGTLRWRAESNFWLDVAAFEALLSRADEQDATDPALLREAVAYYRGDLLPACYDEWIEPERDRLRRRCQYALERLAQQLAAAGDHAAALGYAEELLGRDPLDEATYRLLMRLHAARGERARALRIYHSCAAMLERELGVPPSAAMRDLYETLLPPDGGAAGAPPQARSKDGPFIGRTVEWERLTALWRDSEKGRAQLVLVTGEPGIGKTRLVAELCSWSARRGALSAEARCYAAEGSLAYAPVAAWLRSSALRPHLSRLEQAELTELARLLPELHAELPDLPRPQPLPHADQRARLFAAVTRAVLRAPAPLLLVIDDVHWCDRESLRLVHHLLRIAPDAPLLLAATARREAVDERHALNELLLGLELLERLTEIELDRFAAVETAALARRLARRPLDAAATERLHVETEGNPLFVVEAVRAGWSGRRDDSVHSSPKIQAVIRQRLAQLTEPARALAGVAATIGREFTFDVLARASAVGGESLVRALDELWRSRIIREHGAQSYDFSHDRIREVAYASLSPARRVHAHLAVAHALERLHAREPGPVSGEIAGHFERAGRLGEAVAWYEVAAEAAQRLHAGGDAVRLLGRALELLATRPEGPERHARELALLTALLTPVASGDGFASPRLLDVQRRSLELVRRLGVDAPAQLLASLALASLSRDDFDAAQRFGQQLHARGLADHDDALLVESAYVLGIAAYWQGELEPARRHFEAAVAGYRPARRRSHLLRAWLDPQVVCTSRLGNVLWFLGDETAAGNARDQALALAAELGHLQSSSAAWTFAALLALEMGDVARIRDCVAALEAGLERLDGRPLRIGVELLRAYLRVVDGQAEAGIAEMRSALDESRGADHAPGMRAVILRLLMAAHAAAGDVRGRLAVAERMIEMRGAARLWEAEARRTRAECLAALEAPADVVTAELQRAIDVARRQGARMLEQRAAASLAGYRQRTAVTPPPRTTA